MKMSPLGVMSCEKANYSLYVTMLQHETALFPFPHWTQLKLQVITCSNLVMHILSFGPENRDSRPWGSVALTT